MRINTIILTLRLAYRSSINNRNLIKAMKPTARAFIPRRNRDIWRRCKAYYADNRNGTSVSYIVMLELFRNRKYVRKTMEKDLK